MNFFPHHVTLWYTHGPGCGSTNVAAQAAESMRVEACAALANCAAALAEDLQIASAAYKATDKEQRDVINHEMQM
jgi:uncharacterized protein (DUF1499 family)